MATKQSTIDFILDQLSALGSASARKMFGNYALYCDGKVVGLVCQDVLFIKITELGRKFAGPHYRNGYAYPGAKVSMAINDGQLEECEWLCELVKITADNLPAMKLRKIRLA
jgi:TfoX/Sxy family transcriptional regulator of competence genes